MKLHAGLEIDDAIGAANHGIVHNADRPAGYEVRAKVVKVISLHDKVVGKLPLHSKIGLLETQYYSAFSIMLKGRASNFYYDKLSDRSYDFQTMINLIKAHFEIEKNH